MGRALAQGSQLVVKVGQKAWPERFFSQLEDLDGDRGLVVDVAGLVDRCRLALAEFAVESVLVNC